MKMTFKLLMLIIPLIVLASYQLEERNMPNRKLTFNLQEGNPTTLHPHLGVDLRSRCLFLALYEPLMRRNAEGKLEPAAAESVHVNDAQTVYTFRLRQNQWTNGKAVMSHHYADAWKFALTPQSPCVKADLFYPIKNGEKVKKGELPLDALKIMTPDEKTLVVELEHPTPYFLDLTATSFYAPLFDNSSKEPAVFNGPFVVGEWVNDQQLVLNKNPTYWDINNVQLDEIVFTMVRDPMAALVMFEKGELDVVGDPFSSLPLDAIPELAKTGELQSKLISRIFYLLLNTNKSPFQSKSIRKALSLSIDRDQLTKYLLVEEQPTYTHLPKTLSTLSDNEVEESKEDPVVLFEEALAELNMTKENFPKIVIHYANLSGQKSFAEFVQEQWRKGLGIQVEIICSEWNVHLSLLRNRDFQVGTLHMSTLYQDPMYFLDLFREKKRTSNYSGWENPLFAALLEKSEKTIDSKERLLLLQKAERQLLDEMPVIPIFTQNFQYLVRKGVELVLLDVGVYDFKWTRVRDGGGVEGSDGVRKKLELGVKQ